MIPIAYADSHYTVETLVNRILDLVLNPIITLLMVIATIIFLWGVIEMIMGADNEEKRSVGKKHIIWGLLGLFIMVSAWGIIQILCNFFGTC